MRLFSLVFTFIVITILFGNVLSKIETIEQLENRLEQNKFQIDSLKHEIDTLHWEFEDKIKFYQCINNTHLLSAIMFVESCNNDSAYRASEGAVGCLQIRKTMVNDINRILKKQKSTLKFTYNSRWHRDSSIQMFNIYCKYYNLNTAEEIARCWNGGPRGMNKPLTATYWKKVKENLDS